MACHVGWRFVLPVVKLRLQGAGGRKARQEVDLTLRGVLSNSYYMPFSKLYRHICTHTHTYTYTGYPDIRLTQLSPHKGAKPGVISWEADWEKGDVLGNEQLLGMVVVPAPQAQALGQATGREREGGECVLMCSLVSGVCCAVIWCGVV